MLIQVLFYIVLGTALTSLSLATTMSILHTTRTHLMQTRLRSGADDAVERLRAAFAAEGRSANDGDMPFTATLPPTYVSADGMLRETFSADTSAIGIDVTGTGASNCAGDVMRDACNLEIGNTLAEHRVHAIVDVDVVASGSVLASDRRFVTLRLFRSAPFALVTAVHDAADTMVAGAGDSAGIPASSGDLVQPDAAHPERFHDTRLHVYAPCRHVPSGAAVSPTEGRGWNDWQGDAPGPAHEAPCDTGAGETSAYVDDIGAPRETRAQPWGH